MPFSSFHYTIIFIFFFVSVSCSKSPVNFQLQHLEEFASINPREAFDSLQTIDYESLTGSDKRFYEFLNVKIADKAFITHTTDSLILRVIEQEQNHKSDGRYPEALYYGGRVYRDLGDYPTALYYFQKALENVPNENLRRPDLKAAILSQYGQTLNTLRLYDQAIPVIKQSIELGKEQNDTLNVVLDIQLLGSAQIRAGDYFSALATLREALALSRGLPDYHTAKTQMYLAAAEYRLGNFKSALKLVRGTPGRVRPSVRNTALAIASKIYRMTGYPDTALAYAKEIIYSPSSYGKETAYYVLLSPELRQFLNPDSLDVYFDGYRDFLEESYDESMVVSAINQQNLYNYNIHERQRLRAESTARKLTFLILAILLLSVCVALIVLYRKMRRRSMLFDMLDTIDETAREISSISGTTDTAIPDLTKTIKISDKSGGLTKEEFLRQKMISNLNELAEKYPTPPEIEQEILLSDAYKELNSLITQKQVLAENSKLWSKLEKEINAVSPKFRSKLTLLSGGKLSEQELHTAILIRCGVKPSQMSILQARAHGTIVSRRHALGIKLLGEKKDTKTIDLIIRML